MKTQEKQIQTTIKTDSIFDNYMTIKTNKTKITCNYLYLNAIALQNINAKKNKNVGRSNSKLNNVCQPLSGQFRNWTESG